MQRSMMERHLAEAETAAAQGRRHVTRQEQLIVELKRDGHPTTQAEDLLRTLYETQQLHEAHRDRLRQELGLEC
jgi:hypothetical protein